MQKSKQSYFSYVAQRTKSSKPFLIVITLYMAFCLASFVYFIVIGKIRDGIMALLFILFVPITYGLEKSMHIKFVTPFLAGVLFVAMGSIMGAGYDLYSLVPFFDTILHTVSGFIFACLGFGLLQLLIGKAKDNKSFAACLLFGFMFSLAIGLVWELFEYLGTVAFKLDMQEDTVIYGFNSYLLSGTHSETFDVNGIVQTVIYFGNGQTLTIDGYIDIGLIDTIEDMAVCFIGSLVYMVAFAIDWRVKKALYKVFIPAPFAVECEHISSEEDISELSGASDGELTAESE